MIDSWDEIVKYYVRQWSINWQLKEKRNSKERIINVQVFKNVIQQKLESQILNVHNFWRNPTTTECVYQGFYNTACEPMQLTHVTGVAYSSFLWKHNIQVVNMHTRLIVNSVLKGFLKKGDTYLMEANLV
jgi:hypothetical protein